MPPDQNHHKNMKDRGGMSLNRLHTQTNSVITPIHHTIEPRSTSEIQKTGKTDPHMPVSPALRSEYNSHSAEIEDKIVQQVDAAEEPPHNYVAAAYAARYTANLSADLRVGLNE
jgi:hypothetical protein